MSYPCNIIQGKAKQFKTYKHAIAAYDTAMVGIPSQIAYGSCQKVCHTNPPWRRHLMTLV
jgi:hypothetical protein